MKLHVVWKFVTLLHQFSDALAADSDNVEEFVSTVFSFMIIFQFEIFSVDLIASELMYGWIRLDM